MKNILASLREEAKNKAFSGHMVIIKNDQVLFELCQGYQNKAKNIMITNETIFHIASGTKFLTALAIGKLIDQKKISLETLAKDIVNLHIEGYQADIKIKHLLSHTSGMPDYLDENSDVDHIHIDNSKLKTSKDYLQYFPVQAMDFKPGTKFKYNNGAYVYLALIIETISELSYQDYINQEILIPLGIHQSGIFTPNEQSDRIAYGYIDKELNHTHLNHIPYMASGDGGAVMNAYDLKLLMDKFSQGKIISDTLKNDFIKPFMEVDKKRNLYYGFGLWLFKHHQSFIPYLEGGDAGISFRCYHHEDTYGFIVSNTDFGVWDMIDQFHQAYLASLN